MFPYETQPWTSLLFLPENSPNTRNWNSLPLVFVTVILKHPEHNHLHTFFALMNFCLPRTSFNACATFVSIISKMIFWLLPRPQPLPYPDHSVISWHVFSRMIRWERSFRLFWRLMSFLTLPCKHSISKTRALDRRQIQGSRGDHLYSLKIYLWIWLDEQIEINMIRIFLYYYAEYKIATLVITPKTNWNPWPEYDWNFYCNYSMYNCTDCSASLSSRTSWNYSCKFCWWPNYRKP